MKVVRLETGQSGSCKNINGRWEMLKDPFWFETHKVSAINQPHETQTFEKLDLVNIRIATQLAADFKILISVRFGCNDSDVERMFCFIIHYQRNTSP